MEPEKPSPPHWAQAELWATERPAKRLRARRDFIMTDAGVDLEGVVLN